MTLLAISLLAASLAVPGCASQRVAFTQHLRAQYDLTGEELKKLQYYLSSDVTLQREFRSEEGEVSGSHNLVRKEGGFLEQVLVHAGTPGIVTEVGETSLALSFEPGSSLYFGSPPSDRDPDRKYKLSAKRWEANAGELEYGGKTFHAVEGSGQAFLTVVLESLDAVEKRKKVLPGMTLPGK
ncbi:MAG TPA: hypothetical protein VF847_05380 [Candidatus Deferrimicrobiaceae bacterium]